MRKKFQVPNRFNRVHRTNNGKKVVCMCGQKKAVKRLLSAGQSRTTVVCGCNRAFPTTEVEINNVPTGARAIKA